MFSSPETHLQLEFEQRGGGRGAVDGPVAPCGAQAHRVVAVHVGQKEQPSPWTLPNLPEVHSQRSVRDNFTIGGHCDCPGDLLDVTKKYQVTLTWTNSCGNVFGLKQPAYIRTNE